MGASATAILANLTVLDFDNESDAAINGQMAQGVGDFIDSILTEFVNTQNSILNVINTQRYGKSGYYTTVALAFQFGDDLVPAVGNLDPSYAVIDTSVQIIKQAAFQNNSGSLSLKIATQDPITGNLIQLTAAQLSAFQSYFVNFEIPGIPVTIISLPANQFSFSAIATFNAGYNLTNLTNLLNAALNTFVTTFAFNGVLYTDQLSDYIKANVPGVIDFFISNTTIDGTAFVGSTILSAGYFNYLGFSIAYNPINQ